jgi:hypothetical protein
MLSLIDTMGAGVNYIVVSDLKNDTFYAKINLSIGDKEMDVDSRPSDALALAVRVKGVPIYADDIVMDKAGIMLDKETGKPISSRETGDTDAAGKKVSEEELRRMSAFRNFIDTLDLDDFDRRKS